MTPKIFLTGVTGYVGGDTFHALYEAHPEYDYTLLVRDEERGKLVSAKYPEVRLVYGDLSASELIAREAAAADVVLHTADSADDMPSARAIAAGLAAGHTAEKPGYWLHLCGTSILSWYDEQHGRFGQPPLPAETYHDIDDIERIVNLPPAAAHRNVDEVVLAANGPGVRTLIVSPPTIYGRGRGPGNRRSMQVYRMAERALRDGVVPVFGTGETRWNNVHVRDLAGFFVRAVAAALDPATGADPAVFGPRAYYFLEHGSASLAELARWLVDEVNRQDLLAKPAEARPGDWPDLRRSSLGYNSNSVAARAARYLGWAPAAPSLKDEMPEIVRGEVERLKELGLDSMLKK